MKLREQYEAACKVGRLARRTIQTYRRLVEEFLRFLHDRAGQWIHPQEMGEREGSRSLPHASGRQPPRVGKYAESGPGAIPFLYRNVLEKEWIRCTPCGAIELKSEAIPLMKLKGNVEIPAASYEYRARKQDLRRDP